MQQTSESHEAVPALTCASCGAPLHGIYCSQCGEKRLPPGGHTLRSILEDWLSAVSHGEGKLLKSLRLLIFKPGFLTREYFLGRRVPYTRPAALFFAVNVVYFLLVGFDTFTTPLIVQLSNYPAQARVAQRLVARAALGASVPAAERAAAMDEYLRLDLPLLSATDTGAARTAFYQQLAHEPHAEEIKTLLNYAERFDSRTDVLARILLVALVPMLGLCLWLVLAFFHQDLPRQIIFAAHFWTAMLLFLVVISFLVTGIVHITHWLSGHAATFLTDTSISSFIAAVVVVYAYFCVRGLFRFPRLACGALALWVLVGVAVSTVLYRILLFYVTFVSLRV